MMPTRAQSLLIVAGLLIGLFGVALHDGLAGVHARIWREEPLDLEGLADGRWGEKVEARFTEESAFMRATRPLRNELLLDLFGESGTEVVPGKAGWFFLRESLQPMGEPGHSAKWFEMLGLTDVIRQGFVGPETRFLVLVMPAKWRLYPEFLPDWTIPSGRRELLGASLAELGRRGHRAPDLLTELRRWKLEAPETLLYPPNDTHFSQEGFARVAAWVATELCSIDPETARRRLEGLPRRPRLHPGDLMRNLSVRPDSRVGRSRGFEESAYLAPPCHDAAGADVLVLGDSFFLAYDGLFQRLIQTAAGKKVDARYAGWQTVPVDRLVAEYGRVRAPFVLLAVTERRFD